MALSAATLQASSRLFLFCFAVTERKRKLFQVPFFVVGAATATATTAAAADGRKGKAELSNHEYNANANASASARVKGRGYKRVQTKATPTVI